MSWRAVTAMSPVHDLRAAGANRAIDYGVVLPAVVVDGELLSWHQHTGAGRAKPLE